MYKSLGNTLPTSALMCHILSWPSASTELPRVSRVEIKDRGQAFLKRFSGEMEWQKQECVTKNQWCLCRSRNHLYRAWSGLWYNYKARSQTTDGTGRHSTAGKPWSRSHRRRLSGAWNRPPSQSPLLSLHRPQSGQDIGMRGMDDVSAVPSHDAKNQTEDKPQKLTYIQTNGQIVCTPVGEDLVSWTVAPSGSTLTGYCAPTAIPGPILPLLAPPASTPPENPFSALATTSSSGRYLD